jgi:PAS domain S-box-containing protein
MRPSASPLKKIWEGRIGLILVLCAGTALSFVFYHFARDNELSRLEGDFNRRATARQALIQEGLHGYEECIYNLRSLFANSDEVTPEEFTSAARDIRTRRPDIQALEWVPVVRGSERASVERFGKSHLNDGFSITERTPDGRLVPSVVRETYYPVLYIHPLEGNERALGYDLGAANNWPTVEKALKNRSLTMTGKIHLVQSGPDPSEFSLIMVCPVYHPDEKGRDVLIGLVQILFRLEDMVGHSWNSYASNVMEIVIEDLSAKNPDDRFLFSRPSDYLPNRPPIRASSDLVTSPRQELILNIADRSWICTYAPPRGWIENQISKTPLLVLIGSLTFTLVSGAYFQKVRRQTALVTSQVHERTAELRHTQNLLETDIAKRQATEAELRESRRQLESLLGQLPGMAYRLANDGVFSALYISHGCTTLTGHTPHDLTTRLIRYDDLVLPEDNNQSWAAITGCLADHRAYEVEYRLRHKNGQIKWVLDRGQGVYDQDGRLLFIEGLAIDITQAKQAEKEKLIIERKLLEGQKLESLGVLAGGIAHDFNNILTGIVGNASLMSLDLPAQSPLLHNVHQIEVSAQRAAELCQQMLAYAGKGQFLIRPINLEDLIRSTLPLLEHSISKRAILRFQFKFGLPSVNADVTQIRQIIMNLVVNASDAIGNNDGVITLSTGLMAVGDPRLRQAVLVPDSSAPALVFLQVNDTGAGMSADVLRKIFEPFYTTKFTGRGLGLAAVLGIVRSHHGGLIVESMPGQGTTFTLLLPASKAPTDNSSSRAPFGAPIMRTGTALIIDDEDAVRTVTSHMFGMIGMKAVTACDGIEGLEMFRLHRDDIKLVLLDLTMPRMNGEETLTELRKLSATVPIIITSGYNRTTLTNPLASEPTVAFLQKPFTMAGLIAQIDLAMS